MNVLSGFVAYGLGVDAQPTRTNVSNSQSIGVPFRRINLLPDAGYSIKAYIASGTFQIDTANGSTSGTTTWNAGTAQVETATASGTASASASVLCTVTALGLPGSPIAISVPVVSGDIASIWGGKVRTALSANAAISERFNISGTGASIVMTRKPAVFESVDLNFPNDATLNIAITNGSPSPGITPAATSANTTAGAEVSGVLVFDPNVDFEGGSLPSIKPQGIIIQSGIGLTVDNGGLDMLELDDEGFFMQYSKDGIPSPPVFSIIGTGGAGVATVTVIGKI